MSNPADGQGKRLQLTFGSESQKSLLTLASIITVRVKQLEWVSE